MKIYQIIDANGEETTYFKEKPRKMLKGNEYDGYDYTDGFLFPIPLKPLQIAEITVNENGTWSYEIEREEGFYMARWNGNLAKATLRYQGGEWSWMDGTPISERHFPQLTISPSRIPDECII